MKFSIIGTGNIAWFLGKRLVAAGHACAGVFGRDVNKARELASMLSANTIDDLTAVKDGLADVCILAVSDTSIPEIATQLPLSNTTLIHTAGAVPITALPNAAHAGVLWPVYSISRTHLPDHRNIPCAWEASSAMAEEHILTIGSAVTDNLFHAAYEQRKWLHLSAVISNNFINHLLSVCEQICKDNQLPFSVLQPIIEQTFERIQHTSPSSLQTGPAARNDRSTIDRQLALLAERPEWRDIYEAITRSIQSQTTAKAEKS
jgi:predicted short-subunit dehydrogenase-like oxidoreductase (DUF2520 family)